MDKFIIFDLDGTLIDTLKGISYALNKFLKDNNYEYQYSEKEVASFIGNGARVLLAKAIKNNNYSNEFYTDFLSYYRKYQYKSKLYKRVKETLKRLNKMNIDLFILSNKPNDLLIELINIFLSNIKFKHIQGYKEGYEAKPDIKLLNESIIQKYTLDIKNGYIVGDSYVDILTGKNIGISTILVTYGYGILEVSKSKNPDYIIDEFRKLLEVIK